MKVREIIGKMPITSVPRTPEFVKMDGAIKILLDIDRVLTTDEIAALEAAA